MTFSQEDWILFIQFFFYCIREMHLLRLNKMSKNGFDPGLS